MQEVDADKENMLSTNDSDHTRLSKLKTYLIYNPAAGAMLIKPSAEELMTAVHNRGLDVELILPNSAEAMRLEIRRLVKEGAERIVVAGGDGTASLAVQEIALSQTTLGILPLGTYNNFAAALHIPAELSAALDILRDGTELKVSVGRIGDHYFTETAGVGLFADMLTYYADKGGKNLFRFAYAFCRVLFSLRARRLYLTIDGHRHVQRADMCMVANTFRTGAAIPVAPNAVLTDEVFDVVIFGDLHPFELLSYIRAMFAQQHLSLPKVTSMRAKEIKIATHRPMKVYCDERIVGKTPVVITLIPEALKVVVPS